MASEKQSKADRGKQSSKVASTRRTAAKQREPFSKQAAAELDQNRAKKQTFVMWQLLSAGGAAYGGKLKPRIEAAERNSLVDAGLIDVAKVKGAYVLTVAEKGWDWAEKHLANPLPDRITGAAVLQGWLARLDSFLRARGLRLADLFTEQPAPSLDGPRETPEPGYAGVRERIRAAYREAAGGYDRRLLLRDLRPKLSDLDRELVDSELLRMVRDGEASLMQLDYRPDVADEDRAASLQIGNEPRHIIWITGK